ncbi:MAG: DUF2127 domain-containing protein [Verrucomicrobia bacterium]|nr:DUF2127 domain-containing protein [Verrucomicrobiota bacterium]
MAPPTTNSPPPVHHHPGLRAVALFEVAKGLLVLLAGLGALALVGENVQEVAEKIVRRGHLNPAHHYPRIFIEAAGQFNDSGLFLLAVAAAVYAAVRFVEGYGLWRERHWAEWFAVISAALYVPLEVYEMIKHPTWVKATLISINLVIVFYLARVLAENRRERLVRLGARDG